MTEPAPETGPEPTLEPPKRGMATSRKAVIAFVAVLAIALGTVIGLLIAGRDSADSPLSSLPGIGSTRPLPLREAIEGMLQEGAAMEAGGEQSSARFRAWAEKYADPVCSAFLIGMMDALDGAETSSTTTAKAPEQTDILSLNQQGDRATVVTKTGDGEPETTIWVRNGGEWRLTCEGMFGN